jgi:hypothetical protein
MFSTIKPYLLGLRPKRGEQKKEQDRSRTKQRQFPEQGTTSCNGVPRRRGAEEKKTRKWERKKGGGRRTDQPGSVDQHRRSTRGGRANLTSSSSDRKQLVDSRSGRTRHLRCTVTSGKEPGKATKGSPGLVALVGICWGTAVQDLKIVGKKTESLPTEYRWRHPRGGGGG